jgi:O-antigen ligase
MNQKYPWLLPILLSPLGLIIPIAPRSGPLWVLLIGIAGIVHFIRHRPSLDWLKSPPIYALCVFLAYLFLTAFWSINPERSFEQAFRLTMLAFFGLAGYSLVRSLEEYQKRRVVRCLLPALFVGIVTGCVYGLLQYTGSYIRILTDFLGLSRELSSFSTENRLQVAKTMLLTNFAFFGILPWLWKQRPIIALGAYGLFLTICWHSDSQSALIISLLGGVTFAALSCDYKHAPKIIMIGIVMSFVVAVPITQSRYMETVHTNLIDTSMGQRSGIEERIKIYQLFGAMAIERPLFGHGLMSGVKFQGALPKMDLRSIYLDIRSPHNAHLQIIFDLGAVGAALLLISFIWPIWRWHTSGNHSQTLAALLAIALALEGALFNFVIWRAWVPSAAILTFYFLLASVPKTRLSDFR